jgi:hypothetical protein
MARSKFQERIAMSKSESIRKLANAIREIHGRTSTPPDAIKKHWLQTPRPHKEKRIRELLEILGFYDGRLESAWEEIKGFKTFPEFESWMKKLNE